MSSSENKVQMKLKALASVERIQVLQLLAKEGRTHVSKICDALKKSQPAMSHDLSTLLSAEIVVQEREGKFNFYSLNPDCVSNENGKTSIDIGMCQMSFENEVKKEKKKVKKSA